MPYMRCPSCNYRILTPLTTEFCPNCEQILSTTFLLSSSKSVAAQNPFAPPPSLHSKVPPADAATDPDVIVVAPSIDGTLSTKKSGWTLKSFHPLSSIKGVVLNVQTQHESQAQDTPNIVGGIFKLIRDIVWPVMETSQQQRENGVVITQIRLRLTDGSQRDARLEGRLLGANIALGDEITLQGRYRKGTLHVQHGYNHTSEARILTRHASSSPLLLIISFIVLIVAVYMLTSGFHHFSLWP